MPRYNLDKIFDHPDFKFDKNIAKKSIAWFDEQVKRLGDRSSVNSIMKNDKRKAEIFVPGRMYLFFYDALHKDTLPYYDTLPLCIPFAKDAETFTGLNLHYLPYKMRAVLLKNLLDFATAKNLSEKSKLQLSWEYIGGISRYRGVNAAVHKYRRDHVVTKYIEIPATQWFLALCLPIERFVSGESAMQFNKRVVWYDSLKYL